jgi:hypothetical protein
VAGLVELATPTIDADPGEESEVGILVYNTGTDDEAFDLEVIGSPAPWSFLDPAIVRIPAGGAGTARLVLRPPKTHEIPAGPMPFSIRLSARTEPDRDEIADGTLDIAPYEAFTARLVPDVLDVGVRGRTRVEVTNDGNVPIVVSIGANSPDGELSIKVGEPSVLVPAGATADVVLRIHPRHRRLFGRGDASLFTVRLESLIRVATLSGRVRPKGAALSVMVRTALAVVIALGLAVGWRAIPRDHSPKKTAKGLPAILQASPGPVDPFAGGITAAEEPSPQPGQTAATAPAPVTVAQGPQPPVSTGGTLPAAPAEVRGAARAAPLRRFFDPAVVDYVYTADTAEAQRLLAAGLAEQGAAGQVYTARVKGTVPLYRLKRGDGHHLFTFDEAERRNEVVRGGAIQEGIAGYVFPNPASGTQPLFRLTKDAASYLTVDTADASGRQANGWVNEGVRGYVLV